MRMLTPGARKDEQEDEREEEQEEEVRLRLRARTMAGSAICRKRVRRAGSCFAASAGHGVT